MMAVRAGTLFALAGLIASSGDALAQTDLPVGETRTGSTPGGGPAEYLFESDSPGFLTVFVRGTTGGGDLVLSVTDEEYQTLSNGRSDQDFGEDLGAEQVMLTLPAAGRYRVLVDAPYGGDEIGFDIGATFLETRLAEAPADPDGRPSQAMELAVGATHSDVIEPEKGDGWDWYRITASGDGVLTVLTRADDMDEGDVKLELFREGSFRAAELVSDQDEGDVFTNESLNVDVIAGQTVYVRVSPPLSLGRRAAYRVVTALIGG
jgi:hypothetical protein